jgi:hypothetical protein
MRSLHQTSGWSTTRNRARLSLEALDARFAPSDLLSVVNDSALPDPDSSGAGLLVLRDNRGENAAPQVTNFSAVAVGGGLWRFTGEVIDETPAGLTIAFGGEPASLQNLTVPTDANGHFDKTLMLHTDGSDNGMASAKTTDAAGLASNVATFMVVT